MIVRKFGPLRSRSSRKPWPERPEILLFRCKVCGRLYQMLHNEKPEQNPLCCSIVTEWLRPQPQDTASGLVIDYKIIGGFNQNAVQVFWESNGDKPKWFLLGTYSGWYIKFLTPKKIPPVVFPLSDEDAYVYCDRTECRRCVFACKKGFVLYSYSTAGVLLETPLDKVDDYFVHKKVDVSAPVANV